MLMGKIRLSKRGKQFFQEICCLTARKCPKVRLKHAFLHGAAHSSRGAAVVLEPEEGRVFEAKVVMVFVIPHLLFP